MPIWKLGSFNLTTIAAGIGVGVAGIYLAQKLVKSFTNDRQKDKKAVNVVKSNLVSEAPIQASTIFAQCFQKAGDMLVRRNAYLEAIACYGDGAYCCPPDGRFLKAKIYGCRASAYQELNDRENVIKDCTLSLKEYNGDQAIYARRAAAYMHYGRLQEALGDYATINYLVKIPDITIQTKMQEITQQLAQDKLTESFQYHSHLSPPKYVVREFMARFHNHPLKVMDDFRDRDRALVQAHREFLAGNILDAFNLHPNDIVASTNPYKYMLLLATAKLLNGAQDVALGLLMRIDFRSVGERDPLLSATILIQTASLFHLIQQPEQAEVCFDQALDIAPDNIDVFFHRGEGYLKLGDNLRAIENYNQALRLQHDFIPAMTSKALALFRQGKVNVAHFHLQLESEALFKTMLQKYPEDYMIHFIYAKVLCSRKAYSEAEEHYNKAHRLAPDIGGILAYKAEMYLLLSNKDKAYNTLQRALKADYACVQAYEKIGYIYIDRNLPAKAIKMFRKGLEYVIDREEFFNMYIMLYSAQSRVNVIDNLGLGDSDSKPP